MAQRGTCLMLDVILADLIENERMTIKKAIIDKDASCHEIILTRSPETEIVFCGNHTAKTFHTDLERVKKTPCQVSVQLCILSLTAFNVQFPI